MSLVIDLQLSKTLLSKEERCWLFMLAGKQPDKHCYFITKRRHGKMTGQTFSMNLGQLMSSGQEEKHMCENI